MAVQKVSFLALLLFGTVLLVSKVERADAKACTDNVENNVGKPCTFECDPRIAYGFCKLASGNERINFERICINCCRGKKGCNYFSADGAFICEGESEYVSNKVEQRICTLECDPRIAYGICPLASGNKRINFDRICTNCCRGKKGCNYFSADGTFICEGESEYVSNKVEQRICTLECDPRIAYGICPLASGNERINFDRICTNCCRGKKGCNYFSADGTFICEGESEYVSNKEENEVAVS